MRPVLFEYTLLQDDRVLLFVGRDDLAEPAVLEIGLDRGALENALGHDPAPRRWPDAPQFQLWQELLESVLEPVEKWTEPGDTVWFVPHAELHAVPLHALALPSGPLIDRNPVCYTPSASIMGHCRARRSASRRRVLVAADSRNDRPLKHAALEARQVAGAFEHSRLLLGDQVTADALREGFAADDPPADVLHLACHAEFDEEDAMASAVLLAGRSRLTAADLARWRTQASLITLSACGSGRARVAAGDELLGLSRAAFAAGAAALIVSLWSVEELSTTLLMRELYSGLASGVPTAAALQNAQRRVRDTTVADLSAWCEQARAGAIAAGDAELVGRLDLDLAHADYLGCDFAAAQERYASLAAAGPNPEAEAGLLYSRRALRSPSAPDRTRRPFESAYYWGAFELIGDWA